MIDSLSSYNFKVIRIRYAFRLTSPDCKFAKNEDLVRSFWNRLFIPILKDSNNMNAKTHLEDGTGIHEFNAIHANNYRK